MKDPGKADAEKYERWLAQQATRHHANQRGWANGAFTCPDCGKSFRWGGRVVTDERDGEVRICDDCFEADAPV